MDWRGGVKLDKAVGLPYMRLQDVPAGEGRRWFSDPVAVAETQGAPQYVTSH